MSYIEEIKQFCKTDTGPYRRPFTPNPDWENADVMVIGTNPATPMRNEFESFEQYWKGLTVEPKIYWDRYHAAHSGKTSKSTGNANLLLKLLEPLNVLVSNVVWFPVEKKRLIPKQEWDVGFQALNSLCRHIQPKVIFCHGADAQRFAQTLCSGADRYQPLDQQLQNVCSGTLVICYHHFSGQGLQAGSSFQPNTEFPQIAEKIHAHAST